MRHSASVGYAAALLLVGTLLSACAPRVRMSEPAPETLTAASATAEARTAIRALRQSLVSERDSITAVVMRECADAAQCPALATGTLTLGMTTAQAMLVTGTTPSAWVMTASPRTLLLRPAQVGVRITDAENNDVLWMRFADGKLAAVSTRTANGVAEIALPTGLGPNGTPLSPTQERIARLIRDGDALLVARKYSQAAEAYLQAAALGDATQNPLLTYRTARALDLAQRYPEAARMYERVVELSRSASTSSDLRTRALGARFDDLLYDSQRRLYAIRGLMDVAPTLRGR